MKYILASASPRRKELLKYIIEDFDCVPADISEVFPESISVFDAPEYLALKKAEHLIKAYPDTVIIGSDTAVIVDGEMLGKPKNKADAGQMLEKLSGKVHSVVTG
ncbi:MAG: Maf family protein, partial [Clostridiales bacterium]|nr:Maf family protein [Candidatus Equinaster intestinalis]